MIDPSNAVAGSAPTTVAGSAPTTVAGSAPTTVAGSAPTTVAGSTSTTVQGQKGHGGASDALIRAPQVSAATTAPVQATVQAAALRMTVEPTNDDMGYTYKFYDRATGELVMELPPDKAAKLGESADYTAGQFVSKTA